MANIQTLVDGMNAQWMRERAESQMTLGKLIEQLETMPAHSIVEGIGAPHSYRGYYSDLAFERDTEGVTVERLLVLCRSAMGHVFEGYKGGDFVMGALTPVWIASYGNCGVKIMALNESGDFETAEDE